MRKRLDASNLPWKEFKDYPKSCFPSRRSEYDGGEMTENWESELRYHGVEELTLTVIKLRDDWLVKEIFLSWAAESRNAKDEEVPKESHRTAPAKEQMIEAFLLWKTASELKLLSEDREYEDERPELCLQSNKRSDRKAKRRNEVDEEKTLRREFIKEKEKLKRL